MRPHRHPRSGSGGRRRRLVAAAVGTAVLLVGCAGERASLVPADLPEPTADPATDLADGASGTTVETADGCRAAPIGDDVGATAAAGADRLRVHRDDAGSWRIRIELADGDSIEAPLTVDLGTDPDAGVIGPLGGADLDGDVTSELFTVVGGTPDSRLVSIHARVGCALVATTVAGSPLSFPVGGGAGVVSGLTCSDGDGDGVIDGVTGWIGLVDPATGLAQVDGVVHRLVGAEFEQVDTVGLRDLTVADADRYRRLDCAGLPDRPGQAVS